MSKAAAATAKTAAPVKRTGTQSIERSVAILRELATRGTTGWGLWDLAARCGLDRGTTHRILAGLVRERLVRQRESDRRYFVGPLVFELGVTLTGHGAFQAVARTAVRRLSRRLPRSVVLAYLRSGDDCVCIAREGASAYTTAATSIRVGHLAPLLSLTGGAAILAALPQAERRAVMQRNAQRLAHHGTQRVEQMRQLVLLSGPGHVFSGGVVWQGINSFSVPVSSSTGAVLGALVASGTQEDYPQERGDEVVPVLQEAAAELGSETAILER